MTRFSGFLRRLHTRHAGPVLIQLVAVSTVFALLAGVAELALNQLGDQNAEFLHDARSALLTQQGQLELARADQRLAAVNEAHPGAALADLPAADAIDMADHLRQADGLVAQAAALNDHNALLEAPAVHALAAEFLVGLAQPGSESTVTFGSRLNDVAVSLSAQSPALATDALGDGSGASATLQDSQITIGVLLAFAAVAIGLTAWMVAARLNGSLAQSSREQATLRQTTATVQRRNEQLQALYRVVTEVTETLSLRYVTETAVQAARSLVDADLVTLYIVRGDHLEPTGQASVTGAAGGLPASVTLGQGLAGRAAKRGRLLKVSAIDQSHDDAGADLAGAQSGIAVPMIVGAKVVGVLACWSAQREHFEEADERILEMMAAQVATAVVAADAYEASEQRAYHDPLTSLPNRRQLTDDLAGRFRRQLADGTPTVVAMIDIDHFKRFNDEFGHRVGDVTLQRVSHVIRDALRSTNDQVYRYGGEEFVIFMEDTSVDVAEVALERVRLAVARTPISGEHLEPVGPVTISIGCAASPEHGNDPELLISRADLALYQSKFAGRNRVTRYADELEVIPVAA